MKPTLAFLFLLLLLVAVTRTEACDYAVATVRSYHFERNPAYNENNLGLGCEAVVSENARLVAGFYRNTYYKTSTYAGVAYTPLSAGKLKAGVMAGVLTGYGRTMLLPIPLLTYEWSSWGINLLVVPPTKKSVDSSIEGGVIGLQVKWRL